MILNILGNLILSQKLLMGKRAKTFNRQGKKETVLKLNIKSRNIDKIKAEINLYLLKDDVSEEND